MGRVLIGNVAAFGVGCTAANLLAAAAFGVAADTGAVYGVGLARAAANAAAATGEVALMADTV